MKTTIQKKLIIAIIAGIMPFIAMAQSNFATALNLQFDEKISSAFETTSQVVYYTFEAPVTGRYWIKSDLGLPIRFTLYNSSQAQINYYDNEYLIEMTAGTKYYLTVKAVTSAQTGNYSFSVVTPSVVGGKGGSFGTAITNMPLDEIISAKFNVPGKVDYYAFTAPVTGRYQIRTDGISNPTRFTLFNSNQTQINYYDNEYLVELTAGTMYYLTTKSVSYSQTGNYSFIVIIPRTEGGRGGSFGTAITAAVNEAIFGEFNVPGKVDYYSFTVSKAGNYKIKTYGVTIPTRFTLYNSSQSQINYYDNEYLVALTAGTTYYLTTKAVTSSLTNKYAFVIDSQEDMVAKPEFKPTPEPPL